MKRKDIEEGIERLKPWYHKISIPDVLIEGDGESIVTPGEPYDHVWDNIRNAREFIEYPGRTVLDLGSFDGMWAFEAEMIGASFVMATDCNWNGYEKFLFCREALGSAVMPLYNVSAYDLVERLDSFQHRGVLWKQHQKSKPPVLECAPHKFDIVQHLGLFYHLTDPLRSLWQARSLLDDDGVMLIETAFVVDEDRPVMLFNANKWTVYDDRTTWWAPSRNCLSAMLEAALLRPMKEVILPSEGKISRIAVVAQAVPSADADPRLVLELRNRYRTPGFEP